MKKRLGSLLLIIILFTLFTACGGEAPDNGGSKNSSTVQDRDTTSTKTDSTATAEGSTSEDYDEEIPGDEEEDGEQPSETDEKVLQHAMNVDAAGFYYGWHSSFSSTRYVIFDAYGNDAYEFKDGEECLLYANGYFISIKDAVYYLKTATGETITSSEALGVTGFGLIKNYTRNKQFLEDGYLFVYKINESYNGTNYEIGIFSVTGKWIVPLSDDHPLLTSGMTVSESVFSGDNISSDTLKYLGEGCILVPVKKDGYRYTYCLYNIKTNKVSYFEPEEYYSHLNYMSSTIEFKNGVCYDTYQSTMYEFHTDGSLKIYPVLSVLPEKITKFSGLYGLYEAGNGVLYMLINDGNGPVLATTDGRVLKNYHEEDGIQVTEVAPLGDGRYFFIIKNDAGSYYYTTIDSTGAFLYEPIKTDAVLLMLPDGTEIDLSTGYVVGQPSGKKLVVDVNTGAVLYETENSNVEIEVGNGIVHEESKYNGNIDKYTKLY